MRLIKNVRFRFCLAIFSLVIVFSTHSLANYYKISLEEESPHRLLIKQVSSAEESNVEWDVVGEARNKLSSIKGELLESSQEELKKCFELLKQPEDLIGSLLPSKFPPDEKDPVFTLFNELINRVTTLRKLESKNLVCSKTLLTLTDYYLKFVKDLSQITTEQAWKQSCRARVFLSSPQIGYFRLSQELASTFLEKRGASSSVFTEQNTSTASFQAKLELFSQSDPVYGLLKFSNVFFDDGQDSAPTSADGDQKHHLEDINVLQKFRTEKETFSGNYSTLSHHQASFNNNIIEKLSSAVYQWFPNSKDAPIQILDLCCGHGKPTYDLLNKLTEKGVCVSKIIGYDISSAQIAQAEANYKHEPRLKFIVQNAEDLKEKNQYDLIVSFFGFHWMESLSKTASQIFDALKPDGRLMFFVPLEKMDLFEFRKSFMQSSKWSQYFKDYSIHPFVAHENEYLMAFNPYFESDTTNTAAGNVDILYTEKEFSTFLSSWMQEQRYLDTNKVECREYAKELLDSIPVISNGNVKKQEGNILFTEHYFSYQGSRRKNLM